MRMNKNNQILNKFLTFARQYNSANMPFAKPLRVSTSNVKYEMCKRNGIRHSIFSTDYHSKSRYVGEWKNDGKDGKGFEISRTNWLYEGDWWHGFRHGYGVLSKILKNGVIWKSYAGNWVRGKKSGPGSHWYPDGSYYEGLFSSNNRHGFGRMWYSDRRFYQGGWKHDKLHADGMLVEANGNRYEGKFFEGKKQDLGIYYHVKSGQIQEGVWEDDTCVSSTLQDSFWRQSSVVPTAYCIPKVYGNFPFLSYPVYLVDVINSSWFAAWSPTWIRRHILQER